MTSGTKRDAIASLLREGHNKSEIARQLGLTRATVRYWADKLDLEEVQDSLVLYDTSTGKEIKPSDQEVANFIQSLAPINMPNPVGNTTKLVDSDIALVIGDTHFGVECPKTLETFYKVVDELRPGMIILNGDTVDMCAVSRFSKDVRYEVDLLEERTSYHNFLSTVRNIVGRCTRIIETDANHSGNGVDGRWWRYLSERLGPVAAIPEILEALTYQKIFLPDWAEVEYVDNVELCNGNLFVMHGDVVRKHGGYSARGMLDKWFASIIMNHTHRMGLTSQHIPAIGSRKSKTITVYENGCACDLEPCYATAPNWQNGFSIVAMNGDSYGVEPVFVNNGVATVATLGKTIRV